MMDGVNLYTIAYYKKTVFKGSYRGLCFRIGRDETVDVLKVEAWKGPYVLEKTDEEIFTNRFEYSDEGLKEANEWLENKQKEVVG